ncbi:hypothetical protein [Dechloromonas denitrificans]|jgi:hypothetical protein|uniref:hypothetical protein n=1 Tax=Azonexaceae TaxID=2008795 RepID=UPI001CF86678|nr:hypothetical protein [Dechloromonas denitrificans]UCV02107.1 hypothetical protein KI611_13480 [Dechloromonas denitrificans]UCV06450.1 hypothetical protein KI615_13600 [Dechloromonas denitrificans]
MSEDELIQQADRMIEAAMNGRTPHQVLLENSLAESANVAERAAAIAKNRERAIKLLAALEKSGG